MTMGQPARQPVCSFFPRGEFYLAEMQAGPGRSARSSFSSRVKISGVSLVYGHLCHSQISLLMQLSVKSSMANNTYFLLILQLDSITSKMST
jgi:hypothetical protein